ncbi:MAG: hypothetical protein COB20_04525 [SAR86 cluster bacterium]|uniref:DUF4440 domain-containing protein n=1 Tax=SAR86 cluster bacterium TaxID=2030880 RepID=A0A2A4XAB6_9GAMM|nr:MAG: hypothetical protein COB20_04525 [SAR86 cluster bacterium]
MNHFSSTSNRYAQQICVFVVLSVLSISAVAQIAAEEEEAIAGAMAAMDSFMLGFNARDPEAWAASLNYPHVRFASGTVTVWESAEEFAQTRAFETLPSSGWDHSHWLTRDVVLVSSAKVHIATVFQRFNSDNEVLFTYESLYIVTKVDGHWGTQARSSLAP